MPNPKTHHLDRRARELRDTDLGHDDRLLTTPQVAEWLHVSRSWLEAGRSRGYGPPFVRIGRRVRYRVGCVKTWLAHREQNE